MANFKRIMKKEEAQKTKLKKKTNIMSKTERYFMIFWMNILKI